MKRALILSVLVLMALCAPLSVWAEVARYNSGGSDFARAIALGPSGNVYVTGQSCQSQTNCDYATVAYDRNLSRLWVARYSGPANGADNPSAIATDSAGNVYVTGESCESNGTNCDYATIAYDPNGNELWVARYNGLGNGSDSAHALAIGPSGTIYVTGGSYASKAYNDYATVAYDANGNELWVARYNGLANAHVSAQALAIGPSGTIYVTGWIEGTGTGYDYATIAYDSSGNELWAARYNGPGNGEDRAAALATDSSGNVYVTGRSYGSGTSFDYATVAYDPSGNELWVARYNGPGHRGDSAAALATDSSGNVYVTGRSYGGGTSFDYATIAYDPSGNELWVARYNGPANLQDHAAALAIGPSGNIYVTGYSTGSGTGWDYATIVYDPNGNERAVTRYNSPANGDQIATAMAIGPYGGIYITGYSSGTSYYDYLTVKYGGGSR
ncbi:MAG: SBBP repeat-containing protein [Alphaproteobacteria bacterium]|uniref:SBBP repeat-containing protein n=1 Tax=Candidatus Nitrobium versatile TaxID=2884831 RepID=A0A953JBU2_9BACT|nr:SBBP repeat-containing protein [Candidatus Nitrobium versatile]